MICSKPFRRNGQEHPCGKCKPCGFNRSRLWQCRLFLELTQHRHTTWITLTYDETNLPKDNSLDPNHFKIFINRLRKTQPTQKIRYYYNGEYGTTNGRPHYHAILFGYAAIQHGLLIYEKRKRYPLESQQLLNAWGKGNIKIDTCNAKTIAYNTSHL